MLDSTNILATQGLTILSIPLLLQWMKESDWPIFRWLSRETPHLSRLLAWTAGILAGTGIHGELGYVVGHSVSFTINYEHFSAAALLHTVLFPVGGQLLGQETVYKGIQAYEKLMKIADQIDRLLQTSTLPTRPSSPLTGV